MLADRRSKAILLVLVMEEVRGGREE